MSSALLGVSEEMVTVACNCAFEVPKKLRDTMSLTLAGTVSSGKALQNTDPAYSKLTRTDTVVLETSDTLITISGAFTARNSTAKALNIIGTAGQLLTLSDTRVTSQLAVHGFVQFKQKPADFAEEVPQLTTVQVLPPQITDSAVVGGFTKAVAIRPDKVKLEQVVTTWGIYLDTLVTY